MQNLDNKRLSRLSGPLVESKIDSIGRCDEGPSQFSGMHILVIVQQKAKTGCKTPLGCLSFRFNGLDTRANTVPLDSSLRYTHYTQYPDLTAADFPEDAQECGT